MVVIELVTGTSPVVVPVGQHGLATDTGVPLEGECDSGVSN